MSIGNVVVPESPAPPGPSKLAGGHGYDGVDSNGHRGVALRRPSRVAHVARPSRGSRALTPGRPPGGGESRAWRGIVGGGGGERRGLREKAEGGEVQGPA